MNKAEVREKILNVRRLMDATEREKKSREIQRQILSLPIYCNSKTIMLYLNTSDEVQTTPLAERTLQCGKKLIIPFCDGHHIIPCEITDLKRDIRSGSFGIREPYREQLRPVAPSEIDLVLVPGIAFDPEGNRIGFGKGYYDRFLPQLRKDAGIAGLAYACQIVKYIENEEHDFKMPLLITENSVIYPE